MGASHQIKIDIDPQPGPQYQAMESIADILIFGGAAGCGKSYTLLMEPLRNLKDKEFGAVIFRRTMPQIRNEGALWDQAVKLYNPIGVELKSSTLECIFSTGMKLKFAHLEYEKNVYDWQGSQIPFIGFDELTHFTEFQFFYMLGRNRSDTGIPGYIRSTCNPDARSWVKRFIQWWIDEKTGYAISKRSGVIRWFIRIDDQIIWADSKAELIKKYGIEQQPKSVTFIAAKLEDNKILMEKDPSYRANLMALPRVERMRLLEGNWNVEPSAGLYFQKSWFELIDTVPSDAVACRYWDRASTKVTEANMSRDPDYTVGLKLLRDRQGVFYVADIVRIRESPLNVKRAILNSASQDSERCTIGIEQDPGQAGVVDAQDYVRSLAGYRVKVNKVMTDKVTRALPISSQCEAGNVKVLRARWNEEFFTELQNFPDGKHDDQIDALSGAFHVLTEKMVGEFPKEVSKNINNATIANKLSSENLW